MEGGQRLIDYRLPAAPYTVEQGLRCILHSVHTHRVPVAQPSKVYYTSCTVCTVETVCQLHLSL